MALARGGWHTRSARARCVRARGCPVRFRVSAFWVPVELSPGVTIKNVFRCCQMFSREHSGPGREPLPAEGPRNSPQPGFVAASQVSFQEWTWASFGSHLCPCAPTVTEGQEDGQLNVSTGK